MEVLFFVVCASALLSVGVQGVKKCRINCEESYKPVCGHDQRLGYHTFCSVDALSKCNNNHRGNNYTRVADGPCYPSVRVWRTQAQNMTSGETTKTKDAQEKSGEKQREGGHDSGKNSTLRETEALVKDDQVMRGEKLNKGESDSRNNSTSGEMEPLFKVDQYMMGEKLENPESGSRNNSTSGYKESLSKDDEERRGEKLEKPESYFRNNSTSGDKEPLSTNDQEIRGEKLKMGEPDSRNNSSTWGEMGLVSKNGQEKRRGDKKKKPVSDARKNATFKKELG